jgi:hypothetical protein
LQGNGSDEIILAARRSSRPVIAVGICTFQRNDLLLDLLKTIDVQTGAVEADVSVLIIDNNPRPSVPQDKVLAATKYKVTVVHEPRPGLVNARNRLFELAEETGAEWLIGTDDDMTVAKDWLSQWIKGIKELSADIMLSDINSTYSGTISSFVPQRQSARPELGKPPRILATGNYAISRSVFSQKRGLGLRFHPDFNQIGGEDSEFFLRAKRQHGIVIAGWPNAIAHEEKSGHRLTLRYHLHRTLCAQMCGFYIAALHRKHRIIENPAPLGLMLTRRTINSVGSSLYVLSLGLLTLPFAPARGQRTIGIGLEHLSRAFAVLPFLFGKSYRRYGLSKS